MRSIAIIGGTGALGSGLALRFLRAGHEIWIGSRDPEKAKASARDLKAPHAHGASLMEAAAKCEICFLTVPYAAHADTLKAVAPALKGKIVIDTTAPLRPPKVGTVQLPPSGSAAVDAQSILAGARVVSALQTIGAEKLAKGGAVDGDVLVASDDAEAAATICALLEEIGLRSWHVGPLANSAAAEAMTSLLIQINRRYKREQAGLRITGRPKDAPPGSDGLAVMPIRGLPHIQKGDDLGKLIGDALIASGAAPVDGDVVVVAQKIVSKAEGRAVALNAAVVTPQARTIAAETGKPADYVQFVLDESRSVMRTRKDVLIVRHRLGHVAANAGIDASNLGDPDAVLLWPEDPDASAAKLRRALRARFGADLAVIISDSLGRAWRIGTLGTAIGTAGLKPLRDRRGERDLFGRELKVTIVGVADEIAAAASLVMGDANEGVPAALVRGAIFETCEDCGVGSLLRPAGEDLFP